MVVDNGRMVARRKFGQKKRKYRAKYICCNTCFLSSISWLPV